MRICGFQGVSAIDFPGRIASVIFLGGCNFRCPFCHNPELVLQPESRPGLEMDDVLRAIAQRRRLVDGVVVTGGEPLINTNALLAMLERFHKLGMAVKLDTNGYEVDTLREVLETDLVDYVAMDVKTSPQRYEEAAGRTLDVGRILDSISALNESGIAHEFRTTCVPGLVELDDVRTIASLGGREAHYVLQQYRTSAAVLDPAYAQLTPHSLDTISSFADIARPLVRSVTLRGL